MLRRVLTGVALVLTSCVAIPVALDSVSSPAGGSPPAAVQQCMNGGWRTLTDASGQAFKNQGRCIAYSIHHSVSLTDLAGSFSGTTSFTFGTGGCSFVEQVFDATYAGTSAVGSVTLHLDGCIEIIQNPTGYAGAFSIATSVGTLAGNAAGFPSNFVNSFPTDFELTLTVLSGTGAFAATTGTIHVSIQWIGGGTKGIPAPVTGSVTVP